MNETVKKNFPIDVCPLMWSIKWLCKQISKKKAFFGDKNSFVGILVCTTRFSCLTFVLWRLTSFFLISKNFYMPPFGRFSFWALARFPEVNHLRYGPVRLVLQWGHARAIIQYYGGLRQRIHEKSSLQIICSYRRNSYSVYVTDALGKANGNIKHLMSK